MYPEETITITSKGEKEARVLVATGRMVIYKYKKMDGSEVKGKYSILLIPENGEKERLMIVKSANGKEIIVNRVKISSDMAFYDEEKKRVVKF